MKIEDRGPSRWTRGNPFETRRGVIGYHDDRLSGMRDLIANCRGMSVFDVAANHGLISFEFALNGARLVHGCDSDETAIVTAKEIFQEAPIPSRFEVVDLVGGSSAVHKAFGRDYLERYDVMLFLGIYHKLKDQTNDAVIEELVQHFIEHTGRYFVVRTADSGNLPEVRRILEDSPLRRVVFSVLSRVVGALEIWERIPADSWPS
jgi:2-polyprenyl-3-methyl-5-hydroxy-6-metoxy-1,4-benzoquinol methylase